MVNADALCIYFGGALFSHKELIGNELLAEAIESHSDYMLRCSLPQRLEVAQGRSVDVRNQDLLQLVVSDLALFNFNGTELDSGTVVEFIMAKMLDIPAVILRTDFRGGGDQPEGADKWNLMCSGYPRTKVIIRNAMALYHQARSDSPSLQDLLRAVYQPLAAEVTEGLRTVQKEPSLFAGDTERARRLYEWALTFPGGGLAMDAQKLNSIIERKALRGLLR